MLELDSDAQHCALALPFVLHSSFGFALFPDGARRSRIRLHNNWSSIVVVSWCFCERRRRLLGSQSSVLVGFAGITCLSLRSHCFPSVSNSRISHATAQPSISNGHPHTTAQASVSNSNPSRRPEVTTHAKTSSDEGIAFSLGPSSLPHP